jgi:imidazolonepropionase
MEKVTCFRNIGQLIQVRSGRDTPRLMKKTRCALLVSRGKVVQVIPDSEVRPHDFFKVADLAGKSVLPGLVDCHTHLIHAGDRKDEMAQRIAGTSYMEIHKSGGGILNTVKATRQATEDDLYDLARQRALRMMTLGTTAFEIKSGYGLDLETEKKMLRVGQRLRKNLKAPVTLTYMGAHAAPKGKTINQYFEFVMEHLPEFRNLADGVDIFCEKGVFTSAHLRRLFLHAKLVGFHQLRAHVDEHSHQGGCYNAARLGAISCDHLEHITPHDIRALQLSGTTAVLMPGATFFLGGKKTPPVHALIKAGVTLALATDCNPGSSPSYNMQTVLGLAQSLYGITPDQALIAATYGSARALDGHKDYGGLLPGQRADFIVLKTNDYRDLFYCFGENFVEQTYSAGKKVKGWKNPVSF